VALVPISISGWGLRELAAISRLGNHGIVPERYYFFRSASASFSRLVRCPGPLLGCSIRSGRRGALPSAADAGALLPPRPAAGKDAATDMFNGAGRRADNRIEISAAAFEP
jgi:hypothetical protein